MGWAERLTVELIRVYQRCVSPLIGPSCRFVPSCSEYAIQAVERHGIARGLGLAARRLLRCHPWGPAGYDPVPELARVGRRPNDPRTSDPQGQSEAGRGIRLCGTR